MTVPNTTTRIAEALQFGVANLSGRGSVNEATTRSVLIDAVLDGLGYPPTHRSSEESARDNRPDYLCYLGAVDSQSIYPSLVVEAKRLGADFDRVPSGQERGASPDRQIRRYLSVDSISRPNTIGVLTDGVRWRVYRRGSTSTDVEHLFNFNFEGISAAAQIQLGSQATELNKFVELLSSKAIAAELYPDARHVRNRADKLFETVQTTEDPDQILKELLDAPHAVIGNRLDNADSLTGKREDAHNNEWETYAVAQGPTLQTDTPDLEGSRIAVAAVQFSYDRENELSRGDVALFARTVASSSPTDSSAVFAYETAPDGTKSARMAVSAGGQVNMTALFDPALPSPSARASIDQQLRLIRDTSGPLTTERLLSPLAVSTLRQQFYREVAEWTVRAQQGKDQAGREAVLRHLIRVIFSWILKEEDRIPPEIFEPGFIDGHLSDLDGFHNAVLRFLFHSRLNVRGDERDDHPIPGIHEALERAPFLNGSLFASLAGDDELSLNATDYWSVDKDEPGLFTILSRYHWTMDEHRPGESEQTLDPELLSNLFERLIASIEEGADSLLRQPQGTYYTPADVTLEMVKDALSAAVRDHAEGFPDDQLLELFGYSDTPLPELADEAKTRLVNRIRELRVFDPAVGSGAFLLSMLLAIRKSLEKLGHNDESPEDIIRRQLRGQDINPLAVQISRLRLFIAIAAARRGSVAGLSADDEALPNLEAVIVCADTLETVADPEWRSAQLDMADPDIASTVTEIAENRVKWFDVHTDFQKRQFLDRDVNLRARLEGLLQGKGELASPELRLFAQVGLLSREPAKTDARLLFYETPGEALTSLSATRRMKRLSKSHVHGDDRKRLAQRTNCYRTIPESEIYIPYSARSALTLSLNPMGGVVTVIVPLSSLFWSETNKPCGKSVQIRCAASPLALRHYGNRPDTVFNGSPSLNGLGHRRIASVPP